ncbi:MAG: hypothetical protein JNL58_25345 [Planctomyces sp.]|nr:hypothetical protein [Planctomyces sp.]
MNDKSRPQSMYAIIVSITVMVVLLGSGLFFIRAHASPQSLVGKLLRGESLPIVSGSPPDWRESSLRPNEYRLTIARVLDESDLMVVKLKIETLQPQWHAIWSRGTTWYGQNGGHAVSGTIDQQDGPNEHGDHYYTGSDTLTASQISYRDQQLARMSLGGGGTTMEVPLKTPLNRVLEITAKDGIYSLHDPIVIGNAFGVEVRLAVGERAKVDAMSETFTQPSIGTGESNDE